jgi:acyl-CoA ligase (AMP-forming) (exosortase A-associated)
MDFLLHHMLTSSANRFPDKEALVHGSDRLTYAQVEMMVSGLAAGLRAAGVQRGDRVAILLEPSVPQSLSLFSVSSAGAVFVPLNHVLFPDQVKHILNDCRVKAIITTGIKLADLESLIDDVPSLEFAVLTDIHDCPETHLPVFDFKNLVSTPVSTISELSIEKDLAAILYTSGSTGMPKGVMLTHAQIMAGSSIVSTYLDITHQDRILAVLPFSFDAGMNQIMTAFQQGASLVITTFVFAREVVQVLSKESITGLAGVPTLWSLLAQPQSTLQNTPLPQLRYITNTGGAMPQPVLAALRRALPATKVFLMYGLTEAFRSTYLPPEELDRRPTSMGKAIPNTEILVVKDSGELCKPGEVGELVHRGPTVSLGYWGAPELTDKVLRPHPFLAPELQSGEKVCYSGDLVKTDEEGFFYFIGRRDAMIKSSGYRISPTEVEEILFQSGRIRHAAVIGVPDPMLGQCVKAFVVARHGEPPDPEGLLTHCGERMPRYMVPKSIEYVEELPKTSSGKVDYPTLRKQMSIA